MLKIELVPDLSHCIETVTKKEYKETIEKLLSANNVSKELKEKAGILRMFLETANFRALRSESERYLADGKKVKFAIYLDGKTLKHHMIVL
jgi:translation initiation factor IF-3